MITASEETGAGEVRRRGNILLVVAPASLPANAWLTLENELVAFAQATPLGSREVEVAVDRAADLGDVLARPWPAGKCAWEWSADATETLERAQAMKRSVDGILTGAASSDAAMLEADLSAAGFKRRLLPAQRDAVAQLLAAGGGGNFSVPGSGKTTMTYAIYALLRAAGRVDRMLVIAPQSAYEAWSEEARDCFDPTSRPVVELAPKAPDRRSEVVVLNYERAAMGGVRAAVDNWSRRHRFLVVFDEAHRAKRGAAGQHGYGALDLASLAEARLVLTGTPMPNGPEDLEAVLDLAWPGHGQRLASQFTPNASRAWVRITKDQLELEEAEVVVEPVRLDDAHERICRSIAAGLLNDPEALALRPDLAQKAIMHLIACASNPGLLALSDDGDVSLKWPSDLPVSLSLPSLLADLGRASRPAKLIAAARHAKAHAEARTKLLIWTNFIGNVRELERLLSPYHPAVITGGTLRSDPSAATDRERELRKFREDSSCSVLIATPQTLGEGISLHKVCQAQLHVDRTYNAGLFLQAMDRTHRVGMPEGTRAKVTVLKAIGTIDEKIDTSLRRKLAAMDEVLKDPALARLAGTPAEVPGPDLTRDDLEELIGHVQAGGRAKVNTSIS